MDDLDLHVLEILRESAKEKSCAHCKTRTTPTWRRIKVVNSPLYCNACGIYYRARGKMRPIVK